MKEVRSDEEYEQAKKIIAILIKNGAIPKNKYSVTRIKAWVAAFNILDLLKGSESMIQYFVSFSYFQEGRYGNGRCCIGVSGEIDSIEDIRKMEEAITKESSFDSVTINNFIKLKGEKHDL